MKMNSRVFPQRVRLEVSSQALSFNFQLLYQKAKLPLLAMIKANAYGHGAAWAARVLKNNPKLFGFGVATADEALEVRAATGSVPIPILIFSEYWNGNVQYLEWCRKYHFEPVLSDIESVLRFQSLKMKRDLAVHIEVNTGMNRMGIPPESLSLLNFSPRSVFTHFAEADRPQSPLSQKQFQRFSEVQDRIRRQHPRTLLHCANSAAIWNAKAIINFSEMDLVRPGLSLYGVRPFPSAKEEGLKRVMKVSAPVLNRFFLETGDKVGYGGTYTCRAKSGQWVATLGAGYGDGVFRSLGNGGLGLYERLKKKVKFLGRVSMDLSGISADSKVRIGDQVILWGDAIDPYAQATAAGTIPYELMTRMGAQMGSVSSRRISRIERIERNR